jgi:hypothetical protein
VVSMNYWHIIKIIKSAFEKLRNLNLDVHIHWAQIDDKLLNIKYHWSLSNHANSTGVHAYTHKEKTALKKHFYLYSGG